MTTRRNFLRGAGGLTAVSLIGPEIGLLSGALAAEPTVGGHLVVAHDLQMSSLDPIMGNGGTGDRRVYNLFCETLVIQESDGSFQPYLAESWELSEDGKVYTFHLRQNVSFQDGTPFDAEAVKFNLERVVNPEVNSGEARYLVDMDNVEVVDDHTVRVNLKQPSGPFLSALCNKAGSMVSPSAVRERGDDFARNPSGTGPFVIDKWSGDTIEASRFEGYWGPPAYLDKVTVRAISNTAVKIIELKSGNIQLANLIQPKDMPEIEADKNLTLIEDPRVVVSYVAFNNKSGPFADNQLLRQAISHSINREALNQAISRGKGGPMAGYAPPQDKLAYGPDLVGHAYDPDLARSEYEKSGYGGELTLVVIQRDPDVQIAQLMQAMAKDAGIPIRVSVLERQAWVEKVLNADYDFGILRSDLPTTDPDAYFSGGFAKGARGNYGHIENPEIWELLDKARVSSDPEIRRKFYVEIQDILLKNYLQTYLIWRPQSDAARVELQGFARDYGGPWRYNTMWLNEA